MKAIEICGLCKHYDGRPVVDELTLSVDKGEFFSLLGVNGAGKTTAIRMLTGVTKPDGGDALLMGRSVVNEPEAVKHCIGVSPQESALALRLSVRENLEFIAGLYGLERRELARRTSDMLDWMGLGAVARQRAGTLSGGWQRRLSIAMALMAEPQILFLDEPTLGLDVLARRELWQLLESLKGSVTLLMTTHYMEEAEALSDRIGILQQGRLNAVGTPRELMARTGAKNFEDAFVALASNPVKGEV